MAAVIGRIAIALSESQETPDIASILTIGATIAIDPGKYNWQGHSANADFYITDDNGNRAFEFTVAAGEIYEESVR